MFIKEKSHGENEYIRCLGFEVRDDADTETMSWGGVNIRNTRFAGNWVKAMTIGGVGTQVRYRRNGCVRYFLNHIHSRATEFGTPVALLHPFSFNYYRKFGYERIADTIIADFPITALDFLPRSTDVVPATPDHAEEIIALYDRCMAKRNVTFQRYDYSSFKVGNGRDMYLSYKNGHLAGYVTIQPQNHYDNVNRMVSDNLHVWEMVYEDVDTLHNLLSFLRMFEGELDTVHVHDMGMLPELDWTLKHYMHTRYEIRPDIMARVLDTEGMLRANTYPVERGVFSLRVEDTLPTTAGAFRVEYENGACSVERLSDTASVDLTVGPQALSRIFYGTDAFDADLASYLDGVKMENDAKDFFRAFPKRINGLYEHF